jgi:hypothetical protein
MFTPFADMFKQTQRLEQIAVKEQVFNAFHMRFMSVGPLVKEGTLLKISALFFGFEPKTWWCSGF